MKAKWFLYILWSVFSLDIASSRTDRPTSMYESPRRKVLKLGSSKTLGLADELSSRDNRKEDFSYLPDVSVTCSTSELVVRVKRSFYGFGADAQELTLGGTCKSNGVLRPYGDLLFTYRLTECNGKREMPLVLGYLNYKFVLHYVPLPNRFPRRVHQVNVGIECRFPRYQHVYQLAVRPTWKTPTVHKRLKGRSDEFQIQMMDDAWTIPAQSHVYLLGQTVNFQVSAPHLRHGVKLFISTCYATTSNGANPSATYTIIDNFGCMLESQRNPGVSQFVSPRTDKTIRFSFSAFQFTSDPDIQVNIHCKLFVTSEEPSPVSKSCTYREKRWRALTGPDRICKCCDSECAMSKPRRAMLEGYVSSGPLLVSDQPFTPEDGLHPVRPSPVSVNDDDQDVIWFETKTDGQMDELPTLEDPSESFDVEKHGDKEQQSYTVTEEEKQHKGEEGTPVEDEEPEIEELRVGTGKMIEGGHESGVMSELIREEESGFRDLEGSSRGERGDMSELEEDTVLRERSELEKKDLELLSGLESGGSELEEGSGLGERVHLQEEEESLLGSRIGEETVPLEGEISQKMEWGVGVGEDQSLETSSEKEDGEKVSRVEDHQKALFSETEEEELLGDYDGLVEMGIVGGRDRVWRFKWL